MLCQMCGKNPATAHIKRIINGVSEEYILCFSCANKLGFGSNFASLNVGLDDFLGKLFNNSMPNQTEQSYIKQCPECGCTYEDISKSGKIGCAQCYNNFRELLVPSIKRIHSNIKHQGKLSPCLSKGKRRTSKIERLGSELKEAIKDQNFEKAAKLRDVINGLKKEGESV